MKKFIKKYKSLIFICLICVILEIIMDLLLPLILSDTINVGILNHDINYIIRDIIIMFIVLFIGIIGSISSTYIASKISSNFSYELRDKLINKILKLKYEEIDKVNIGHTVTLLTNDISNIENIIFLILKIIVKVPLIIIGSIILCLSISIKMSSILLIVIPIIIIISIIFIKKTYPYFNLTSESLDIINSNIRENIDNIKLVKSNNKELYEKKKFDKINKQYKDIDTKALKTLSLMMPIIIFIINITTIVILLLSKIEINNGFLIGNVTAFIEYINLLLTSIISTSMIFLLIVQSSVSIRRIKQLLNKEIEINNIGINKHLKGDIEFKNVCFSYNKKNNLEDINLKINKGEKVAIIGGTGSGKSTLINLIKRNYQINKGTILIDNIDINDYELDCLKNNILIVNQKTNLFKNTIKNNLKFNNKVNISKYIEMTLSNKIINKKEKKLNYLIEQNGKNLSGGERQRLILCRSLIKDPDILILDDSLSAVDLKTEEKIINNLIDNYPNKTIIFITNRIKSIKNFDKIILLDNGKVKNIGNHNKLKEDKLYNELYNIGGIYE